MAGTELPDWADYLFTPSRYKVAYGGRGGSKSHTFARALIIRARQQPLRILCGREIQLSIKDSVKHLLDGLIRKMGLARKFRSTKTEIACTNGSVFFFSGLRMNIEKVKSFEGINIVWVEEAQTISQTSLDILIPTIREEDSELWFTFNRRRKTDPVDEKFLGKDGPPPDTIIKKVTYRDNPWFPNVLKKEMEWDRSRDMDKFNHIWEGEHQNFSEALVFKNWIVQSFDTPDHAIFYFGADWGFATSPNALIRCFIIGRTLFIDYEVVKVKCEIDDTPALFDKVPGSRQWMITADSSRPETISYMKGKGFKIRGAKKGPGSVEEGVKFIQNYDVVIHPRCPVTADEFGSYEFETDPLTNEVIPILKDEKNHIIDSARYALEEVRRKAKRNRTPIGLPPKIIGAEAS